MTRKAQKKAGKSESGTREATVHARLTAETIAKLDTIARKNNITRAAVVAIACARIAESGL
jgi:hypothetical protein